MLDTDPGKVRANAYDMVINGTEVGGGSIRIHDRPTQQMMFNHLGFSEEEAKKQFGFLMEAFEFGAPPHGGIAFGFDRLCSIFGGADSIRDFIAFPKNNAGKDVMIDTPSTISEEQLKELGLRENPDRQPRCYGTHSHIQKNGSVYEVSCLVYCHGCCRLFSIYIQSRPIRENINT